MEGEEKTFCAVHWPCEFHEDIFVSREKKRRPAKMVRRVPANDARSRGQLLDILTRYWTSFSSLFFFFFAGFSEGYLIDYI